MLKNRVALIVAVAVLFVVQGAMQLTYITPKWQKDYSPHAGGLIAAELSPDQVLLQLFGFREFLAGILWVRADGFFDDGNYDAILPIIRLCTTLDPKQIDIYATGMWHIGYNFTDEDQRSDRRYIPSALALGKKGAEENPNTYELFFETGWMWYHKIQDDPWQTVKWLQEANRRADILQARKDLLSNAYQRNGQVKEGLETYFRLYKLAVESVKTDTGYSSKQIRDVLEQNTDTMIVRMVQRGWFAQERNDGSYATGDYDTKPPFDTGFSCRATVVSPRVIKFDGTWRVQPVGTRIRVIFRDADYPGAKIAELNWDGQTTVDLNPPTNLTFMQDDLYVKNQHFSKEIDMSKDPTMYPCASKNYLIEFYYSPRLSPPHIQDKFGWNGEGMKDGNFSNTDIRPAMSFTYDPFPMSDERDKKLAPVTIKSPGIRVMYTTLKLNQDQVLQRGAWSNRPASVQTANYKSSDQVADKDDVLKIPTLRSSNTKH